MAVRPQGAFVDVAADPLPCERPGRALAVSGGGGPWGRPPPPGAGPARPALQGVHWGRQRSPPAPRAGVEGAETDPLASGPARPGPPVQRQAGLRAGLTPP